MGKEERLAKHSPADYLQIIADLYRKLGGGKTSTPAQLAENVQSGYAAGLVTHEMLDDLAVSLHQKVSSSKASKK